MMKRVAIVLAAGCAALALSFAARGAGVDLDSGGLPTIQTRPAPDAQPGDFGIVQQYFTTVDASSLKPYQTGFNYARNPSGNGIYCLASSTDSRAASEFHVPHGARFFFFRYWGVDSVADDMTVNLTEVCQPDFLAGAPVETSKGTIVSSGSAGQFSDSVSLSGTADSQSCTYRVVVQFDPSTGSCTGTTFLAFYKARVAYFRQISPAPAVATFSDVGVGTQFFAEVEALARSGITGGCTGTTFCPTQAVTRLQMAAFLARALGLQFDTIADPANP
jgi:predicted small secreted protein